MLHERKGHTDARLCQSQAALNERNTVRESICECCCLRSVHLLLRQLRRIPAGMKSARSLAARCEKNSQRRG
jgi:hypothetical protein